MPVHRTKSGGYQWGKSGKVYYGAGAKEKAERQMAKSPGYAKRGTVRFLLHGPQSIFKQLEELIISVTLYSVNNSFFE